VRRKQPAEALPFARKAASLAPRVERVLDTLGWIEHLLGNHQVAADLLADAVRLESNSAEIRLHAAIVYAALGRGQQSRVELEQALKLEPGLEKLEEVQRLKN
jgi:Flp pilus assembly protein TadD